MKKILKKYGLEIVIIGLLSIGCILMFKTGSSLDELSSNPTPTPSEMALGGVTRTKIGAQTAWTTSLVPSASFTVNLGSAALPVNKYFGTTASISGNSTFGGHVDVGPNGILFGSAVSIPDVRLIRNGTNSLMFDRNGTNAITLAMGSSDGTIRLGSLADNGNSLTIKTISTSRDIIFSPNNVEVMRIIQSSGVIDFTGSTIYHTDNTYDIGATGATRPRTGYFGTSLIVPKLNLTGSTATATGDFVYNTASSSISWYDSANIQTIRKNGVCFTYIPSPLTSINQQIGKRFFDPFTITAISPIASPSGNAIGWNLYTGAPGSVTTAIFSANKSASSSTSPIYTSFTTSALTDGAELDVKITSASSKITQFSINICGRY